MFYRHILSLALTAATTFGSTIAGAVTSVSQNAQACKVSLSGSNRQTRRMNSALQDPIFSPFESLDELYADKSFIYSGAHNYIPGKEFLASNEIDWTLTPYDHAEADVLIGYGTNAAWEIAADKKVKHLILADWSPNPLIAQRFILTPFFHLAETPTDLILLLGGVIPNKHLRSLDVESAFDMMSANFKLPSLNRLKQIDEFMIYLAQQEAVSDFELKTIRAYMLAHVGQLFDEKTFGPFVNLIPQDRNTTLNILGLLKFRYNRPLALQLNRKTTRTQEIYETMSVFHNIDRFRWVKSLYMNSQVSYATTTITNPEFYRKVRALYPNKDQRFSMNLSNIFDCSYSDLTFFDLQNLLKESTQVFEASRINPFVVFRTTNYDTPHGYYRYDLTSEYSVPRNDEEDSRAQHIPNYNRIKSKANGF